MYTNVFKPYLLHYMGNPENNTSFLEDSDVSIRLKLAGLWTSVTLCYLYGDYFELYVPQKTQGLLNGENLLDSPIKLLTASMILAIPALMVAGSLILRPAFSRGFNIFFGVGFTVIMLLIAATSWSAWRMFYVFYALMESGLTMLIVYLAWKWKIIKK